MRRGSVYLASVPLRLATRSTPWLVALALLGASLTPCPRPGPHWLAAAAAAGGAEHADCHRAASERFLDAPCPCGCKHEPASPAGHLGDALPGAVASLGDSLETGEPASPAPSAPAAPIAEIDHVPRIA
jgi:hypothetical protein